MKWLLVLLSLGVSHAGAQEASQPPQPILREVRVDGATVFTRDDVTGLLDLRDGSPLPKAPGDVAKQLQAAYARDGYSEATVTAAFDDGRLTLTVDEGRIDEIEILGETGSNAERIPAAPRPQARRHLQQARHRPRDRAVDRGVAGGGRHRQAAPAPAGSVPR